MTRHQRPSRSFILRTPSLNLPALLGASNGAATVSPIHFGSSPSLYRHRHRHHRPRHHRLPLHFRLRIRLVRSVAPNRYRRLRPLHERRVN